MDEIQYTCLFKQAHMKPRLGRQYTRCWSPKSGGNDRKIIPYMSNYSILHPRKTTRHSRKATWQFHHSRKTTWQSTIQERWLTITVEYSIILKFQEVTDYQETGFNSFTKKICLNLGILQMPLKEEQTRIIIS